MEVRRDGHKRLLSENSCHPMADLKVWTEFLSFGACCQQIALAVSYRTVPLNC